MLLAAFLFSLMGVCTKAATRDGHDGRTLPGGEIAFFRYLVGLLFLLALNRAAGVDLLGGDRRGLLWRGVFGGVASVCFFLGIQYTTLTHATLLNYTLVIWAPLLAVLMLGEHLSLRAALALFAAFAGVLLVLRPEAGGVRWGDALALASGVLSGAAVVQIRRLRQGESAYAVFFYFNLLGLPISLLALLLTGDRFILPTPAHLPLLLAIGATSVAAQLLMTYGYREMTAAQGSLLTLISVLFSTLLAALLFDEALTVTTLLGGALILASAIALCAPAAARPLASTGSRRG